MTLLLDLIYVPTKYYQIISNSMGVMAQDFGFRGDKYIKQELSFLHATLLLYLIYVPTKYYQIISNSMGVRPAQDFNFRGDKCIIKKVIVVSLAPVCLFIPTKYESNPLKNKGNI